MKMEKLFWGMLLVLIQIARAGDPQFVATFNTEWQTMDASNILTFVESELASCPNAETLLARAIVATSLQQWGRGGVSYVDQAIQWVETNSMYSASGRAKVLATLNEMKGYFEALSDDCDEPLNSQPSWNTNHQAVLFRELGAEVPFLFELQAISLAE